VFVTDLGEHDLLSIRSIAIEATESEAASEPTAAGHG